MKMSVDKYAYRGAECITHFKYWQHVINAGEVCSVFTFPISGIDHRARDFVSWQQENDLSPATYIDVSSLFSEESAEIVSLFDSSPLILSGVERWLTPDMMYLLTSLLDTHQSKRVGAILLMEVFPSSIDKIPNSISHKLMQNIDYMGLFSYKSSQEFIAYLTKRWQLQLDKKSIDQIYQYTGGQTWLIKQIMRQYYMSPHLKTLEDHITTKAMQYRTQKLWQLFGNDHKQTFKNVINKSITDTSSTNDLINLKYINPDSPHQTPGFIQDLVKRKNQLKISNNHIIINNNIVTNFFSRREIRLLQILYHSRPNTVTREKIAQAYWLELFEVKYSDWALDQAIRRLRKKLSNLHVNNCIATVRNVGYRFEANNLC